jgi:hypothetical protein
MILIDQQRPAGLEEWEDAEVETEFCKQVFDLSKSEALQIK